MNSRSPRILSIVALANLLLVLAVVNGAILQKKSIVDGGRTIFLKLAPVDPRSLMQGDYMILRYDLSRQIKSDHTRGRAVLQLEENHAATFSRIATDAETLSENEVLIEFRKWRRGYKFGLESFFFQEGQADRYASAKYAEIRITPKGTPVLIDLHNNIPKAPPL